MYARPRNQVQYRDRDSPPKIFAAREYQSFYNGSVGKGLARAVKPAPFAVLYFSGNRRSSCILESVQFIILSFQFLEERYLAVSTFPQIEELLVVLASLFAIPRELIGASKSGKSH
jgi:hypothetical protein